ncbi:MAG TPA: heparinase II/III family protein [Chthoniobacteraceae bacterium]|nr:heparinase II/III family protein [Chthoniobacteraceae bacterium]
MFLRLVIAFFLWFAAFPAQAQEPPLGREENIRVRSEPQKQAPPLSGPYPEGVAEQLVERDGEVRTGQAVLSVADYRNLRERGFFPTRKPMSDQELRSLLTLPEGSGTEELIAAVRARWQETPALLAEIWGFTGSDQRLSASRSYDEWFDARGRLLSRDLIPKEPPYQELLRWAWLYRLTGEEKWAAAVRDLALAYYRKVRPPAGKVQSAAGKLRTMWHPLTAGAGTPMLVEAYGLICGWKGLTERDHLDFLKSFVERGRYLRYTTVPYGPWPGYNPFGYGNWILYQLQGMLAVAVTFPEISVSAEWTRHAAEGIGVHSDRMILPDGGVIEYSYDYANQIAAQFEWCYMMFSRYGVAFPAHFRENVYRLHQFFVGLSDPHQLKFPFGDSARGPGTAAARDAWAALAFGGAWPLDRRPAATPLLGKAVRAFLSPLSAEAPDALRIEKEADHPSCASVIFPDTGWAILRPDWSGKGSVMALSYKASEKVYHSGYEALGFNLWHDGIPFFVKLQGRAGYARGYPPGYQRTPRLSNNILIEGGAFTRESGSLRNGYTSAKIDYLDADHLGWEAGRVRTRRRVLFIKPGLFLLLDDVSANARHSVLWQAHTGELLPELNGKEGILRSQKRRVEIHSLTSPWRKRTYETGGDAPGYFIQARQEGRRVRFETLLRAGSETAPPLSITPVATAEGIRGVAVGSDGEAATTIYWEAAGSAERPFVAVLEKGRLVFLASDPGPGQWVGDLLEEHRVGGQWNGRLLGEESGRVPVKPVTDSSLNPGGIAISRWSGVDGLTTVRRHARLTWKLTEPALHSVLYREKGGGNWRRQFQPRPTVLAWLLLPDLKADIIHEIQAISEFPDGRIWRSEVMTWNGTDDLKSTASDSVRKGRGFNLPEPPSSRRGD